MSKKRSNVAEAAPFDSGLPYTARETPIDPFCAGRRLPGLSVLNGTLKNPMAPAVGRAPKEYGHAPRNSVGLKSPEAFAVNADEEYDALSRRMRARWAYRGAKRAFDVVFSLLVIAALIIPCVLLALAIWFDDPHGSPIFRQRRVGKDGRIFTMYKFRSMCAGAEDQLMSVWSANEKTGPVFKMKDDPRTTRLGRFIRKASIDELPQFVNVLMGDMSVVGPRPALPIEVAQYAPRDRLRLAVKPGITCTWQTRPNRDDVSFEEWVDLDLEYIDTCTFRKDIALIVRTVGVVLTAEGL